MLDLGLINGTVVSEAGQSPLDLGIEGGKIVALEAPGRLGPARTVVDAAGLTIIPGVIDVHFHCRAPSHPERGDFGSETAAAVAGGVTTVFEMPISLPACSTPEVLEQRRALAEAEAYCNVALYSGAVLGGAAQAQAMAEAGAIGFKLFTISPQAGRELEFEGLWTTDEAQMYKTLKALEPTGLRCVVHAENESLLRHFELRASNGNVCRPPVVEAVAIGILAAMAADVGAPIHVAHVSSELALDTVRGAIAAGAPITAETCPQYLTLDSSTVASYQGIAKVAPPLRRAADADVLWGGLVDGTLSVLASDHSPFLLAEKTAGDLAHSPTGLPTVELLVPVALDAVSRGVLTLERAVELIATNPSRLFGLYPEKGVIALGADADLTLVSFDETFAPSPETFRSRAAECAVVFTGMSLQARVKTTIVDGTIVYSDTRICAAPAGRFVPGRSLEAVESV